MARYLGGWRLTTTHALAVLALLALASAACQTTTSVAFVNPLDQPVYVTVNSRPPFEVPANGTVRTSLPAIERLTPVVVTARDSHGATVFAFTTSLPRIEAAGNRVELKATGQAYDPLQQVPPYAP